MARPRSAWRQRDVNTFPIRNTWVSQLTAETATGCSVPTKR